MTVLNKLSLALIALSVFALFYFSKNWREQRSLRMPFESEIVKTFPWEARAQDWGRVKRQIFQTLFKIDTGGKLEPEIVTNWKSDSELKKFYFEIRDNIFFSNGKKLTVEDVIESLNFQKNTNAQTFEVLANLNSIQKNGQRHFSLHFEKPSPDLFMILAHSDFGIYPATILKKTREVNPPLDSWIGSGPYMLAEIEGDQILLQKNPHYKGDKYFDRISFTFFKDQKTALIEGKVDMIQIDRDEVHEFKKLAGIRVASYPILGSFFAGFNLNSGRFNNLNLRKAIKYATNLKDMVKNYDIADKFIPRSIVPFGLVGFLRAKTSINMEAAKNFLAEVPKSILSNLGKIRVSVPRSPHPMASYAANKVVESIERLGLNGEVVEVQNQYAKGKIGDFYHHLRTTGDFDLYVRGMVLEIPSPQFVYEHNFKDGAHMNLSKFFSPQLENLLKTGPTDLTEDSLTKFYIELNEIVEDNVPVFPLGVLFANRAISDRLSYFPNTISPYFMDLNKVRLK